MNNRMRFKSKKEFFLSVLGFSAGYGTLWRFPYVAFKNGGGVFLIPYLFFFFVLVIPIFYHELALGQIYQLSFPLTVQKLDQTKSQLAYLPTFLCFHQTSYVNLLMTYSVYYFFLSFFTPLPWTQEDVFSSKDYFYREILNISDSINNIGILYQSHYYLGSLQFDLLFFFFLSIFIVYICIRGGIEKSAKVAVYTASTPYILLIIMLIRGIFLEGALDGISYLLIPDLSKLFDSSVWIDAAIQVMFQIAIGTSVLNIYGSYRDKNENLYIASLYIPLLTFFCGLLASFVIFSYIGHLSKLTQIPIENLPISGPELAFVLYPAILEMMPLSNFWSCLFFLILILLGIDTIFGFVDNICGTIEDVLGENRRIFGYNLSHVDIQGIVCMLIGMTGLIYCTQGGFYILIFVDIFANVIPYMMIFMFEITFLSKEERYRLLKQQINESQDIPKYIEFSFTRLSIYVIIILSVFSVYQQYLAFQNYNLIQNLIGLTIIVYPCVISYWLSGRKQEKQDQYIEMM